MNRIQQLISDTSAPRTNALSGARVLQKLLADFDLSFFDSYAQQHLDDEYWTTDKALQSIIGDIDAISQKMDKANCNQFILKRKS